MIDRMWQSPIISGVDLARSLDDLNVKIIDCRFALADPELGGEQYRSGHIAGANYLHLDRDLSSPILDRGGRHPLPDPDKLAAKLAAIGIEFGKTLVVAYDDSRGAFASRLWWLLRYLGHDRVAVLDGGYRHWVEAGYPVDNNSNKSILNSNFQPILRTNWIVDIEIAKQANANPEIILIDAREPDRYHGKTEPIDPVAGAIPGAVNYPWQDATTPEGFFLPVEFHRQRWEKIAKNSSGAIVYCGSGVTACVDLLSMAIAGIEDAKLYPGGWSDWCSYLT
jgi:thiosulfate/3-mercaptopyruvate sulfurtransferase